MNAGWWITTAMLIFLTTPVLAHGGGLNSKGCHNQRSTGSYHCHRAQTAQISRPVQQSNGFSFANCTQARREGYSNIRIGEYGYGSHLDRDNDGIACER